MSTKIYTAYRVHAGPQLWPTIWEIKRRGMAEAKASLSEVYRDVLDGRAQALLEWSERKSLAFDAWCGAKGVDDTQAFRALLSGKWSKPADLVDPPASRVAVANAEVAEAAGVTSGALDAFDVDLWVTNKYRGQLGSPMRSRWDLDVSVRVYVHGDHAYMIPRVEQMSLLAGCLDFMAEMTELDDFAYWNNTDRPAAVSPGEWDHRARVWAEIFDGPNRFEFFDLTIVSFPLDDVSPAFEIFSERMGPAKEQA